jgi:succinate-semialdehyde dehydrogenase / glutarate-semialdehyde dehydrogenase
MKLVSTNPAAGYAEIGSVETSSQADVADAVAAARAAQPAWAALTIRERSQAVLSFSDIAQQRVDELAQLMTAETGRLLKDSYDNIASGQQNMKAYADMAESCLAPEVVFESDNEVHTVVREPWGVVACVCPWNFPFQNIAWQCAQALIAGNVVVYKNSEENPLFAEMVRSMIAQSDIPNDVFRVVQGDGEVGRWLVESDVDMVSFTGSSATGKLLARSAGERLLPVHAELGGSSPGVVFADADVDELLDTIYSLRFSNCGQYCDALKRLIVHESRFQEVVDGLALRATKAVVGDPTKPETEMGPLVAQRQLDKLEEQVADAIAKGANVVAGGGRPSGLSGAYYQPTILTNVTFDMRVWREEVFGPVLPVVSFSTEDEAIALANDTLYGLTAYVMTSNHATYERVAAQLKAGAIGENAAGFWSAQTPFGGYKQSGLGRANGHFGFHDMTQVKTISSARR